MNELDYMMDYDDRREYVRNTLAEYLKNDDDAFVEAVEELISWNNFIDVEVFSMDEIDEVCYGMKPSELIEKMTSDFNSSDDYFYFSIWGLESCNDRAELYHDECDIDDVIDAIEDYYNHLNFYDSKLDALAEVLYNGDFGIESDWEYDEDDEDNVPEETDDEFKNRIDTL
jgi:hypothetical protein